MPPTPTPKAGLDRSVVVRAAAALVNAEGVEALTINRLARELGVQPPSLYNHIEGLAALWQELAILNHTLLGDSIIKVSIGKSGPAGLRALAYAYRAHIQEYPGLYQASLRTSRKMGTPDPRLQIAEDRVVQVALAMVESFGIAGAEAIHAVRALRSMVHGFATLEAAGGFGLALSLDESFDRLIDLVILGLENTRKEL
jgi:AcrR family transcriptional regulator